MRILKFLSALVFVVLLMAVGVVLSYRLHNWQNKQQYTSGWKDGYNYIKSWKEIQEQIGATPDDIPGPNTIAKYELALGNQQAEWSMCSNVREFDQAMLAKVEK